MKIRSNRPIFSQKLFWLLLALLLTAAVIGTIYILQRNYSTDTMNLDPPTNDQINAGESIKDRFADSKKDNIETDITTPTVSDDISIIESHQDKSLGKIIVKTRLSGTSWDTCNLKISSSNGKTINKTSATIYQPEYTICGGFSIDRNEFSNGGEWVLDLTAIKLDESIYHASANITIE